MGVLQDHWRKQPETEAGLNVISGKRHEMSLGEVKFLLLESLVFQSPGPQVGNAEFPAQECNVPLSTATVVLPISRSAQHLLAPVAPSPANLLG